MESPRQPENSQRAHWQKIEKMITDSVNARAQEPILSDALPEDITLPMGNISGNTAKGYSHQDAAPMCELPPVCPLPLELPRRREARQQAGITSPGKTPVKSPGAHLPGTHLKESPLPLKDKKKPTLKPIREKTRNELDMARRRQMSYLQKQREEKRMRVFYNRLRRVLRTAMIFVVFLAFWKMITGPFWTLPKNGFEIDNTRILKTEDLKPYLATATGKPLYLINPRGIADTIKERFPIIDQIYIRRQLFPARLSVTIIEKRPWAQVIFEPSLLEQQARIESGLPVTTSTLPPPTATAAYSPGDTRFPAQPQAGKPFSVQTTRPNALIGPRYQIIPLQDYGQGQHLFPDTTLATLRLDRTTLPKRKPEKFLKTLDKLTYQLRAIPGLTFDYLDARKPNQLEAHFREISVRLGRPDGTLEERLNRLPLLVPKIHELQGKIDWVDLRWNKEITFHKRH